MIKQDKFKLNILTDIIVFALIFPVIVYVLDYITGNNLSNLIFENINITDNINDTKIDISTDVDNLKNTDNIQNNFMINNIQNDVNYIQKMYNIKVVYGEDTKEITKKISATEQNDLQIVYDNLQILKTALGKYPNTFYNIFRNNNVSNINNNISYSLEIVLLDKFNNNNIALASRNNLNEYKIYISNNNNFERSFHHEMLHIIEYYILNNNEGAFSKWDSLNITNENIDENSYYVDNVDLLNDDYVCNSIYDYSNTCLFVSKYSKVSSKEDRAEIFAEIMIQNYSRLKVLTKQKAEYLVNEINNNLNINNKDNSIYWNKIFPN